MIAALLLFYLTDPLQNAAIAIAQAGGPASQSATAQGAPFAEQVAAANSLQAEGKRPFHLRMTFQLFDLAGKPEETGSLEDWWAGPDESFLTITSPSIGTVHNFLYNELTHPEARRALYLARTLLMAEVAPAAAFRTENSRTEIVNKSYGSVSLRCIRPVSKAGPTSQDTEPTQVCFDAVSKAIRIIETPTNLIIRNRPASFADTQLALDLSSSWEGKQAIQGHVEELAAFDAASSKVPLHNSSSTAKAGVKTFVIVSSSVMTSHRISGPQPVYPSSARDQRISGTVLLLAVITKEGDVASLAPLASPDKSLTDAALQTVSHWKYTPYTLNGDPTGVDTTLSIHFALNGQR